MTALEINEDMFIVCKEADKDSGEIIIYDIGFVIKDNINLKFLQIRQRYNYELKYYAILESNLDNKEYITNLIKKGISSILYTYI